MSVLLDRRASLIVGTRRIRDGLRIAFAVEKKGGREASKATISVTNLAPSTRAEFEAKGLRVVLEAGYVDDTAGLFLGTSYKVAHSHAGVDFITTIEAADGGKEIASAIGAWSFGAGSSTVAAVRALALGLGLPLSTGSRINPKRATLRNGFAFAGLAADGLDAITKGCDLRWSVQDGQVQILDDVEGDGVEAVVLNAATGLLGSPERTEVKDAKGNTVAGVTVRCLLQPRIRPDRLIVVRSIDVPALSGTYVVRSVKAAGDTDGADWTMTLDCRKA